MTQIELNDFTLGIMELDYSKAISWTLDDPSNHVNSEFG